MRVPILVRPMLVAVLAVSPVALHAQIATSTVCNDGTIARTDGAAACTAHRGVDQRRTTSARSVERTQSSAQAGRPGMPAPRPVSRTEPARSSSRAPNGVHRMLPGATHPSRPVETARRRAQPGKANPKSGGRLCKDGTTVYGNGKEGNCGGHGGVAPHGVHTARTETIHDRVATRRDARPDDRREQRITADREHSKAHDRDHDKDTGKRHAKSGKDHDRDGDKDHDRKH